MIITKTISSKSCVEAMLINTKSADIINTDEVKLWTAEVFDLIGYPLQYIPKVTGHKQNPKYDYTNYKVPLPCDFLKFIPGGIVVNGYPVRWRSNSFHYLMDGDCCDIENLNKKTIDIFTDNFGNEFSPQFPDTNAPFEDITFDVYNDEIQFNKKEGKVCLAYYAYPIDNEGFVMIPDTVRYRRAITDYLIWRTDYIMWRQGLINQDVYREALSQKNFSVGAAISESKTPDEYQLSSMRNTLVRLLPIMNAELNGYKDLGSYHNTGNTTL